VAVCSFAEQLHSKFAVDVPLETVATSSVAELARWIQASESTRANYDVAIAREDLQRPEWTLYASTGRVAEVRRAPIDVGAIILTGSRPVDGAELSELNWAERNDDRRYWFSGRACTCTLDGEIGPEPLHCLYCTPSARSNGTHFEAAPRAS
jgi:hypothetical protein